MVKEPIKPEIFIGLSNRMPFEKIPKARRLERSWQIIEDKVSEYYGMEVNDIKNRCRKREYVTLRQMCWVFMHECSMKMHNKKRFSQIARRHGFDHASCIHAYRRMKGLIEFDKDIRAEYDELHKLFTFTFNIKL